MAETLLFYFVAINLTTLVMTLVDRVCATYRLWRVPESWLLSLSWAGGAAAVKFTQMLTGHMRSKHEFTTSLNLIVILQSTLVIGLWSYHHTARLQSENLTALEAWMGKSEEPKRPTRFGPGSK